MPAKKTSSKKLTDAEQVALYMSRVKPVQKAEVEALRKIIKSSHAGLNERIKWNAPSYYLGEDIVTFGPYRQGKILLVFHHPSVVKVKSPLLEGDYKDRRLAWFSNMNEIKQHKNELTRIILEIISHIKVKQHAPASAH